MVNRCPWFSISSIQIGRFSEYCGRAGPISDHDWAYDGFAAGDRNVVCRERFYLLAETGEAAGWVKNIRRNPRVCSASQNGKLTRWRVCWTVKPIANCGTKWLQSPIANMDGATGCRWKSRRFPHAAPDNSELSIRLRGGGCTGVMATRSMDDYE